MRHAIDGPAESWASEYRFQRKDGTYASVQDRGYIVRKEDGRGVRMVGGMRDLTAQKKMEAQQLRAQRIESIGTLAGGIAHDLNNVLAPIMMSIELLQIDSVDDPRRKKILETIYASCRRGAELVRQVLSFALRLDGQRVAIRLRPQIEDLKGIVSETFPRNIRIVSNVTGDLWPVTGDPTQIHQVLLNLALNARDAMPRGGTLTLSAANTVVDAQFAATSQEAKVGMYVMLEVTDTGIGIAPEVRARIFEPFFTTKDGGKDTGIGLATALAVVRSHGGFLSVESEVGRGSSFKVYLPADPAHLAADVAKPAKTNLPRGRGELVLVVDDEPSIRDITKQTLEAFGYRVLTAADGAEAVALYAKHVHEIDAVLTDMMMPVMDGPATIQVLMRINPAVTIIAASGIASGSSVAKASRAGVKHFLLKPYTAETLLKLFRVAIDGKAIPVSAEPTRPEDAPPTNGISLAPAVPHDHAVR
jgi:signal transduction histidine kinase/ActR/RegA family two-component response regulator